MNIEDSCERKIDGTPQSRAGPDVEPEAVAFLINASTLQTFKSNECLINIKDLCQYGVTLQEGLAVVECEYPEKGLVPTRFICRGDGLSPSLVAGEQSAFQLRAVAPSKARITPVAALLEAFGRWPLFARSLLANLIQQSIFTNQARARIINMPLAGQIVFLFGSLATANASQRGDPRSTLYRIPQALLGAYFGVPREEIGRKLKQLERDGYLERHSTGYTLNAPGDEVFSASGSRYVPRQLLAIMQDPYN